jgi:PAS domain S-box-containing protein
MSIKKDNDKVNNGNILPDSTSIILESISDGVFTVDSSWQITSFNRAAEDITCSPRAEVMGRNCSDVFRASMCEGDCALRRTMASGKSIINKFAFIVNARGERVPVSVSTALLRDRDGKVVGGVETFRDLSVIEALRKELTGRHTFKDIISKNQEMLRLFGMLELIAGNDTTVLLEGESGTGKELFVKAIHALGHRAKGPLVTVNCGAIPDSLLESELFGYKKGAFTDAKKDKPGRLALARGGTLFLDEIGDISPMLQVKLLRVLQDKVYEPLGGTTPLKADVRIVAATNKNLQELVDEGVFRPDLYYRINVVKLRLPPLKDRKEDIPLLVNHFLNKFDQLHGKKTEGLTSEALACLMAHDYPGNVRELENIIEYASVVCGGQLIGLEHLPDNLSHIAAGTQATGLAPAEKPASSMADVEKDFILDALHQNGWNRAATANQLGIHPSTLWRKLKRLNITLPNQDGRNKTAIPTQLSMRKS